MATYPAHGSLDWDTPLKEYIDDTIEDSETEVESEITTAVAAEAALARDADNLTSGTVADARVPAGIGRSIGSRKFRGGNITVKPSQSWATVWSEWDWDNWIKPQVDRAVVLGLNGIRIIGAPDAVLSGGLTQNAYNAHMEQLAAYCSYLGLMFYPCLCEKWVFTYGHTPPYDWQDATATATITSSAAALAPYKNIFGFDLFQEGSGQSDGLLVADVVALYAAIRDVAPGIPVTTSNSSGGFGTAAQFWADTTSVPYQAWTAINGSDFCDLHVYLDDVIPADMDAFLARVRKPVLIGEYGIGQDRSGADQTARFTAVSGLHNRQDVLGSLLWALADQSVTAANEFGVWDNTGYVAGVSPLSVTTGRRTAMTDVLSEFNIFEKPDYPYIAPNLVPPKTARARNSTAGWAVGANTYTYNDERGLGFSATASGTTSVGTTPTTTMAITGSTWYRSSVEVLAGTTSQTVHHNVDWYTSGAVYISSASAQTGASSTVVPLHLQTMVRSPSNAAYAVLVVRTTTTNAANEAHIILNASLISAIDAP